MATTSTRAKLTVALAAMGAAAVVAAALSATASGTDITAESTLAAAQQERAVCAVMASSADSASSLTRANNCLRDTDRAIAALEEYLRRRTTQPAPTTTSTSPPPTTTTAPPSPEPGPVWPNESNSGVPAGWAPLSTRSSDLRVTERGAVVEDVRLVGADLIIDAADVTVRRVEIQGGHVDNAPGSVCRNGLTLEQVTIVRATGQTTRDSDQPAVMHGGYTARRVKIVGLPEGFRAGGRSLGCGPVTIVDSYARVVSPDVCGDWHGDGIQGYDGPAITVRNVTVDFQERGGCGGTAPFFYPDGQGNVSATIDRLLVKGGGYAFRLGEAATVKGLAIVDGSWSYGPIDVKCSAVTSWAAQVVRIDAAYQVTGVVRDQPCNTETGR